MTDATYTLQILHASDFEAGTEAVARAKNFAAIVDTLEDRYTNSITLASGDTYIPGPFTAAGTDPSVRDEIAGFYEQLFGLPGGSLSGIRNGTLPFNAADIAILNAIGVQATAIGNHDFDLGPSAFAGAVDFTPNTAATLASITNIGALFPYLSANLDFSGEPALSGLFTAELRDAASYATTAADLASPAAIAAEAAGKEIAPWSTIQEGGETVGILAATTQTEATVTTVGGVTVKDPAGDGGVDNMDELAAILQVYVDQMTAQGITKIVLMTHLQQYQNELLLATKLSGVDVIVAGGSHEIFADATDPLAPGDTAAQGYPVFRTGADGETVAIVNTGPNYEYVGRLVVGFDADGHVIPDSVDPAVSGAYVTTDAGVDAVAGDGDGTLSQAEKDAIFADGTRGGEVQQITDAVGAIIAAKDSNVVGFTDVFLEGRRNAVRSEETNLGDLTADANLAVAKSFDTATVISIKNGGGIRAEIGTLGAGETPETLPPQANPVSGKPEGGISQLDIENSLRFNNTLSLVTLDAQGLLNAIENALRNAGPGLTPGNFPQISGLVFSWDPTRASLDRVVDLAVVDQQGQVIDVIAHDGALVGDAGREFRLVTLNFIAGGGDSIIVGGGTNPGGTLSTYASVADLHRVDLSGGSATGFGQVGGEQAALADYLGAVHGTPDAAFDAADTPAAADDRTQNLAARGGDVIGDGPVAKAGLGALVVGTSLANTIDGGQGEDSLYGAGGDDLLRAGVHDDTVGGGDGADTLIGGSGADTVTGGAGDDRLNGRVGDDVLTGGAGSDDFVFAPGGGHDRVTDFEAGIDHVLLRAFHFAGFAALQAAMTDTAAGVEIDLGGGGGVLLEGTTQAALAAADFIL